MRRRHRDEIALIDRVLNTSDKSRRKRFRHVMVGICTFLLFGVLVSFIAFFARPPHAPVIYKGMEPSYNFAAPFSFPYKSDIAKQERVLEARANVAPVYKPNLEEQKELLARLQEISTEISDHFDELKTLEQRTTRVGAIARMLAKKSAEHDNRIGEMIPRLAMDHSILLDYCGTAERHRLLFEKASELFLNLAKRGIYDDSTLSRLNSDTQISSTRLEGIRTENFPDIFSQNLTTELWSNVFTDESPTNLAKVVQAVENIFAVSNLVRPNMVFDLQETIRRQNLAEEAVPDVVKMVQAGDPLLQKNVRVTDEILERWKAFRTEDANLGRLFFGGSAEFFSNSLYTFCVLFAAMIFCVIVKPGFISRRSRQLALSGALILLHVGGLRLLLEFMESPRFEEAFSGAENIQLWLASPAVVAIIATVMLGSPLAIVLSIFSAAVATLMLGGGTEILLTSAMAIFVAVYVSRNATKRGRLLRAGFYSGLAVAITSLVVGLHDDSSGGTILYNSLSSIGFGLVSGIFAAGVLSILEGLFKITTDITLIELTDYNHPLLRRLQIVAPGTFHHSVMVGNFAARVAQSLDANVALCRCAALYHDVGKTLKPEFFTENQTNRDENPHDKITPSMSALIIKSHVREGSALAADYNLPIPVRDLIEQHHGRSLVSYFFRKAKELAVNSPNASEVSESNYRYDGPKPQTVEAAIMMMSDIVEAASRSLKKISPQSVEDLIEKLIASRIQEGEFDECPITLKKIKLAKQALRDEVLRSNHSRISYQEDKSKPQPQKPVLPPAPRIRVVEKDAGDNKAATVPPDNKAATTIPIDNKPATTNPAVATDKQAKTPADAQKKKAGDNDAKVPEA
ncbi:MAG: HDIG domain-containing protein [Opitutae bacterium]|nr:HDIG domain-containing protein [Opitutae bacterium]